MRENCTSGLSGGRGLALRRAPSDPTPTKLPNKVGQPAAEAVEGRGLTKENASQQNMPRTQSRKWGVSNALERVRQAAWPEQRLDAIIRGRSRMS